QPPQEASSHQVGHAGRGGEEVDAAGCGRGIDHHQVPRSGIEVGGGFLGGGVGLGGGEMRGGGGEELVVDQSLGHVGVGVAPHHLLPGGGGVEHRRPQIRLFR